MTNRVLGLLAASSMFALTAASAAPVIADNTPPSVKVAHDDGIAAPSQVVNVTVHLVRANNDVFKAAVDALYDPASPTFHHWMTDADLRKFSPTAAQIAAVRAELERNGLVVTSVQKNGFSLRARGALGNVAHAFNTEIHNFSRNGKTFRANIRNARLNGVAGDYVSSVAGVASQDVQPMFIRGSDILTGKPYPGTPVVNVQAAGGLKTLITDHILAPPQTYSFGSGTTTESVTGLVYHPDPNLVPDYTPRQLQRVYGMDQAYDQGLDGTGQTIVLLEGYGYPTAEADGNTFSKMTDLPALTPANFHVTYPQGKPVDPKAGLIAGWNVEIALDIDWSHAIAPGAKILVVASNGQSGEDFQAAMQSIIDDHLGYAVSDSWEEDVDALSGPDEQQSFEDVLIQAAAKGVSFQFSTGDSGDEGFGPRGSAGVPAVSPHAVAVGGTSVFNVVGGKGFQTTAWGEGDAILYDNVVFDPPILRDIPGGGGGESLYWPKPAWQSALPGTGRQTPDISALGNPLTGVPIVVTSPETKLQVVVPGFGGTSLSSPIFTAIWAVAQQKAGHPLGQASPIIAGLTSGVTDVLPISSPDNFTGSLTDATGTSTYTAKSLFKGFYNHNQNFLAPIYSYTQFNAYLGLGFGLDSSFTVTPGWDNATGYGTPDGLNFINAAASFGAK